MIVYENQKLHDDNLQTFRFPKMYLLKILEKNFLIIFCCFGNFKTPMFKLKFHNTFDPNFSDTYLYSVTVAVK